MQAKTFVEFSSDIFNGAILEIEGSGKVIIRVDYPKIESDRKEVKIELEGDGNIKSYILIPGDSFNLTHRISVKVTKDIRNKHLFPITFTMDDQTYKLNRTKQNKLILTK